MEADGLLLDVVHLPCCPVSNWEIGMRPMRIEPMSSYDLRGRHSFGGITYTMDQYNVNEDGQCATTKICTLIEQ